jgi:hypothetical protein
MPPVSGKEQMDMPEQKLLELKSLWDKKRGERMMPQRAQFSTRDFRAWYGNLALIDIPSRTVRLCGTNLISRFGCDATGRDIADLDELVAGSIVSYIHCARKTQSSSISIYDCTVDGMQLKFQELILPLSDDATDVTMILLGSYEIERRPAWQ